MAEKFNLNMCLCVYLECLGECVYACVWVVCACLCATLRIVGAVARVASYLTTNSTFPTKAIKVSKLLN